MEANEKTEVAMKKIFLLALAATTFSASPLLAEDTIVPRFDLHKIRLEGNSLLSTAETETVLAKFTGPQKDFGTLQEAMEELEQAYKKQGYNMVTVILPEQELKDGEVFFQVIEPKVKKISVKGNKYFSKENILATLPTLKQDEPPRLSEISANLRAVNENPSKNITLQFKSLKNPEDLNAQLQVVDEKPWKVALTGDNSGTRQSGYYRMGLTLQHSNLWDLDHVASLAYSTSPDHADKVTIVSGSYRIPLYGLGDTIDFFGGYSDVDNGNSQISGTDLSVSGKGIVSGARYNLTLPRFGAYEHKLQLGMDYRRYNNTVLFSGVDLANDVVAHPFSITYGGSWSNDLQSVDGYAGVLHNQPWGGKGKQRDFNLQRDGAAADYTIFRYGVNTMRRLPGEWLFRLFANGQYSPDRLISGEQFGLGGANSVRGYLEREESYDGGLAGSVEIYTPDIAPLVKLPKTQLRLVGFFDAGTGYNLRTQPGETGNNTITGTGAGFRLAIAQYFSFSLDWGYALDKGKGYKSPTFNPTSRGNHAVHFKGAVMF